jgi:hypothetical protein
LKALRKHELRLDKLEEELKKEKEKMKQLVEFRKKEEMETWEKLKLKTFLEGSTSAHIKLLRYQFLCILNLPFFFFFFFYCAAMERTKVKQAVVEQHAVPPPAALRPLINSKTIVPGPISKRSPGPKKGSEFAPKQPSLPPASPVRPTPSSSSSTTTAPPPSTSAAPPPSSATPSIASRSHSPTDPTTRRP